MRYIPETTSDVIVQVPEDKNSYVNVRNVGASGRGDLEFTGTVSDIVNNVVTIINIADQFGNSVFQYQDLLKQGVEIQVFSYGSPLGLETPSVSVSGHISEGNVDFSGSLAINPNLNRLVYYIFGLNVEKGTVSSARTTYTVGSKVLNPDLWNTEQFIQLNLLRSSTSVLPVVYRAWGSNIKFLGVIGNNKVGYPGSGSVVFRDLGNTEIPSWEFEPTLPSFLSGTIAISGGEPKLVSKLTSKETLEIAPKPFGSIPNYIQCTGLSLDSGMQVGNTVKFRVDDTKFVRRALFTAGSGQIKEVFFPSGVYNIRDSFFINTTDESYSNVSLRGVGDASIIRRLPCTLPNTDYPGLLSFSGNPVGSDSIEGIRVSSIALGGSRNESFSFSSPIESEVTLRFYDANNITVSSCTVFDNGGGGIAFYNSKGINLLSNRILRSGRAYETPVSPLLIDTSENIVAQGNIMEFATTGPKVISTDFSTINANIIRSCGDRGLILETSFQWNSQGNLAYSDNDSLIKTIDTYNNEYSRASIEVRKGFSLDPIYMTVTFGGESVQIARGSVIASIFALTNEGSKIEPATEFFQVLETSDQLEAGIFSITLPGGQDNQTIGGRLVPATGSLNNASGYVYEVSASVKFGKFRPLSIEPRTINNIDYMAIRLRNSSDLLGFQIYSEANTTQNDSVSISGFDNENLEGWDQNGYYPIVRLDPDTNSILINSIPELASTLTGTTEFSGSAVLSLLRPNYFIADGDLIVQSI